MTGGSSIQCPQERPPGRPRGTAPDPAPPRPRRSGARAAAISSTWPPWRVERAADPKAWRWNGYVLTGEATISWFYGDLPAGWLGARGVYLHHICRDAGDRHPITIALPPEGPCLFDTACAVRLASQVRAAWPQRRIMISCDDDWWHQTPWLPAQRSAAARAQHARNLRALETARHEAAVIVVPSSRLAERMQRFRREVDPHPQCFQDVR